MQSVSSGCVPILSRHGESTGWGARVNFSWGVSTFVEGPETGFGGAAECGVSSDRGEGCGGGECELGRVLVRGEEGEGGREGEREGGREEGRERERKGGRK